MVIIAVSGTPGTGKTTLANQIAQRYGFEYVDIMKIIQNYCLGSDYDSERDTIDVDTDRLYDVLFKKLKEGNYVIDSHLSHYLPFDFIDFCVICRCNLKELKKRLTERGYSELKINENLEAETFDTCLIEAQENRHNVIDASRNDFFKLMDWLIEA